MSSFISFILTYVDKKLFDLSKNLKIYYNVLHQLLMLVENGNKKTVNRKFTIVFYERLKLKC